MDFTLFVGDYAYSSWSLRGWLLLDAFGIPFTLRHAHMKTPAFEDLRAEMAPSRLVPTLAVSDGTRAPVMVWETLAIAETLHEYYNQVGLWPKGESARPTARAVAAEMHAGFTALRSACPMNMRRAYEGFDVSDDVRADLNRLSAVWAHARARATEDGPFLFGAFSAVDAFFAPVASRIATYGLAMPDADMEYVAAVLGHPSVRRWRAMGQADGHLQSQYEFDYPARPNPHDPVVTGLAVTDGTAENSFCPFSGLDVSADGLVAVDGRVIGFCNPFCRDKVAADPMAWPDAAALLSRSE
ncbi:MAG: glutathione S-transferase [Pseudomonadota bacterium]